MLRATGLNLFQGHPLGCDNTLVQGLIQAIAGVTAEREAEMRFIRILLG